MEFTLVSADLAVAVSDTAIVQDQILSSRHLAAGGKMRR
jgi:hypothetical protein